MPVEFAYAQARAQAQHGRRLSAETWSLLDSSVGLGQFLHHVRATSLAPRVERFSAASSPHVIERSLRREWHDEVECAARWVPDRWRAAVEWTAALAELPMREHLGNGGEPRPWMTDDPVLVTLIGGAGADVPESVEHAGQDHGLAAWLGHWRRLWPADAADDKALQDLLAAIESLGIRRAGGGAERWRDGLERRAVRVLRRQREQPVTVFCHLLLCALELHRLREGLLRRALFNDLATEAAA